MNRKKAIYVGLVVAIAIISVIPINNITLGEKEKTDIVAVQHKIIHPHGMAIKAEKLINFDEVASSSMLGNPIANSEDEEVSPAIESCSGENFLVAYADQPDITTSNVVLVISTDGGATWDPHPISPAAGNYETDPAIAYRENGNMAVAAWGLDPTEYAAGHWLILLDDITDSSTWTGGYYTWSESYNVFDWRNYTLAGYYSDSSPTFWGLMAFVGSVDDDNWDHAFNVPFIITDGTKWYGEGYVVATDIGNWTGCHTVDVAVDNDAKRGYMVCDFFNSTVGTYSLGVLSVPMETTWDDDAVWESTVIPSDFFLSYSRPDISIGGGRYYIVCETNENGNNDIACFSSTDGFQTVQKTLITSTPDDETDPHIVAYGDIAQCIFTRNGNLYETHTNDGGATWSEPQKINDMDGSVKAGWHSSDLTIGGNVVWTDMREGNADVYFANIGVPAPIINIEGISGGLGVKATISNTGTVAAENVPWSIDVSGGLVILGKHAEGTIASLPAGGSATIGTGFMLGIGKITVDINVGGVTKEVSGFLLGPLVLGLK